MIEQEIVKDILFKQDTKKKQSRWKDFERRIAKAFNGKRALRGQDFSSSDSDIEHDKLVIECKYRKTLNKSEIDKQLSRYMLIPSNKGKLPIAVYQYPGSRVVWVRIETKYYYFLLRHLYHNKGVNKLGELIKYEQNIAPNPYIEIELNSFLEVWQNIENRW